MPDPEEVSLFALGTTLLQKRRVIIRWAMAGAVLTALRVAWRPLVYQASGSFASQASEGSRSSLAELAGQFGLSLFSGGQASSPDFYASLLKSRVLLGPIVHDTFVVQEMDGRHVPFVELFKIDSVLLERREEAGVKMLKEMVEVSVAKSTGVVSVAIKTRWKSVSREIVQKLIDGVNDYNQRTRQTQAAAERRFLEARLASASTDLRGAEARLGDFLQSNRVFVNSTQLRFQHDRLQRDVNLRQQVVTTLTQALEDARIREVRDTPVITVVEAPAVNALPEPRGRIKAVLLGFLGGGFLGVLFSFAAGLLSRTRVREDPTIQEFFATFDAFWRAMIPARFRRTARNA